MDPITIGAIGAGAGALANYASGQAANSANQRQANLSFEQARSERKDAQAWQKYMSNTAHQREMMDLRKAGLNPTLAAAGGGASTPSSSGVTRPTPVMQAPQINTPQVVSTFTDMARVANETDRLNLDKTVAAAGMSKTMSETQLNKAKTILAGKGMPRAMLEGEASEILRKGINYLKKETWKPTLPKSFKNIDSGYTPRGMR